jgi:hypothetical protein
MDTGSGAVQLEYRLVVSLRLRLRGYELLGSALWDVVLQVLKLSKDQSVYNFNITFPPKPRSLMWYFGKHFLSTSDPTFSIYSVQSNYFAFTQPILITLRDEYKETITLHEAKEFYITKDMEKKKAQEHFIRERKKKIKKIQKGQYR